MKRIGAKKESALERRLNQVKKDLALVNGDVKAMSKAVREADGVLVRPKLRSVPSREEPAASKPPAPAVAIPRQEPRPPSDELFPELGSGAKAKSSSFSAPPAAAQEPMSGAGEFAGVERSKMEKNKRFANYFVSGGMDGIRPLRQERTVQRNKAIAMVVFVVLVLIWVLYLIF